MELRHAFEAGWTCRVFAGGWVTPQGDTIPLGDAAFVAEKLVIDRGN